MKNLFRPKDENFNDFDLIVSDEELFALFVRKTPYPKDDRDAKMPNRLGLARSEDGKTWEDLGTILHPSPDEWDQSLWAGSVVQQNGQYTLYYTGVTEKREASSQIGRAFSDDLRSWQKDSVNPILTLNLNNPHYSNEPAMCFRDPYPVTIDGKRYLLIAAKDKKQPKGKRGCIGLVEENTEGQFVYHPPVFSPGTYSILECPALYNINDHWYLFFGDDEQKVFRYAVADTPLGPFTEPGENQLLPKNHYCVRLVQFKGVWTAYCWVRDFPQGMVREQLKGPYVLKTGSDGTLSLENHVRR